MNVAWRAEVSLKFHSTPQRTYSHLSGQRQVLVSVCHIQWMVVCVCVRACVGACVRECMCVPNDVVAQGVIFNCVE